MWWIVGIATGLGVIAGIVLTVFLFNRAVLYGIGRGLGW